MAVETFDFTTGPSTLPDVGKLSYNGCTFSPLFASIVRGTVVQDMAKRTTKWMEYDIAVDGFVTGPGVEFDEEAVRQDVADNITTMRSLLTAHGGSLIYQGRGCELNVNPQGNQGVRDVAWGPVPELLEFQPMGGGLCAKIQWRVKVRIPEVKAKAGLGGYNLLQFNYETSVGYGEDGYSSLSIRGTLEIPLTRTPNQATRTLTTTADDSRKVVEYQIISGIDLSRFRITKRDFFLSRDKRTIEWEVYAEEKPYMDLPPGCTIARGTFSFRPAKAGMGLVQWLCTLRVTYTVRADFPRRVAWHAFLALLRQRMSHSVLAHIPILGGNQNPARGDKDVQQEKVPWNIKIIDFFRKKLSSQNKTVANSKTAWLIDIHGEEGLHLDSKTVTFGATWKLVTTLTHILLASGLWVKLGEEDASGTNLWKLSISDVMGSKSWLQNKADPKADVIVDFGN